MAIADVSVPAAAAAEKGRRSWTTSPPPRCAAAGMIKVRVRGRCVSPTRAKACMSERQESSHRLTCCIVSAEVHATKSLSRSRGCAASRRTRSGCRVMYARTQSPPWRRWMRTVSSNAELGSPGRVRSRAASCGVGSNGTSSEDRTMLKVENGAETSRPGRSWSETPPRPRAARGSTRGCAAGESAPHAAGIAGTGQRSSHDRSVSSPCASCARGGTGRLIGSCP
jgi:hypothetical protein